MNGETVCPRCDSTDVSPREVQTGEHKGETSYPLTGGKGGKDFQVHLYKCNRCDKRFRILERV